MRDDTEPFWLAGAFHIVPTVPTFSLRCRMSKSMFSTPPRRRMTASESSPTTSTPTSTTQIMGEHKQGDVEMATQRSAEEVKSDIGVAETPSPMKSKMSLAKSPPGKKKASPKKTKLQDSPKGKKKSSMSSSPKRKPSTRAGQTKEQESPKASTPMKKKALNEKTKQAMLRAPMKIKKKSQVASPSSSSGAKKRPSARNASSSTLGYDEDEFNYSCVVNEIHFEYMEMIDYNDSFGVPYEETWPQ